MSETRIANAAGRKFAWVLVVILFLMAVPLSSSAQIMGTILGTVKDSSGGTVPQAKVTMINTDTNDTRIAATADDGSFRFPGLVAGHYSVRVEKEGFEPEVQTGLTLEVAQELVVNTALQVGSSTQEVKVSGDAPLVNTTSDALGGLVNEQRMEDLPLNGRNYTDLTFIQPGVTEATNISATDTQGGIRGIYFSSDGSFIRGNLITLDGATLMNQRGATSTSASGAAIGVGGVKEYKVVSGVFDASYGLQPGAQVVMVSKGGSNQFHGEAFEYLRNSALDAANYFDQPVQSNNFERLPPFRRNNFGAAFGGPIKKDKTFFYAVYEGVREDEGLTTVGTVPAPGCHGPTGNNTGLVTSTACPQLGAGAPSVTIAPVMSAFLALYPLPNLPNNNYTAPTPSPSGTDWGQIRVDQNFSPSDTMFGRYTEDKSHLQQEGLFPEFASGFLSFSQFMTVSENHIFSSNLLNGVRLSYSRANEYEPTLYPEGIAAVTGPQYSMVPGDPLGSITLTGYSGFGASLATPPSVVNTLLLNDDVYYTKGKHSLKFGTQITHFNQGGGTRKYFAGSPTFSSLSNFLTGVYTTYIALQGGANANTNHNWMYWVPGFYAQDDWRLLPRLTLNLGLRYEFMTVPHDTTGNNYALVHRNTDTTATNKQLFAGFSKLQFSPRVGFAWDVLGDGKTSVRGGFGQYYSTGVMPFIFFIDVYGTPPLAGILTSSNPTKQVITLPVPISPTAPVGLVTTDYNLKNPYSLKWNLTVERQLPAGIGLQVGYVGTRGVHLYQQNEGNPTLPTEIMNGYPYWNGTEPRINPNFASNLFVSSTGSSTYNAMQVAVNKRLSHGIEFQTSYTYSHAIDDVQSTSATECSGASGMSLSEYEGPGSDAFNKGPACFDARHNLRFNVLYHIPNIKSENFAARLEHGWWVGTIWSAQTGFAFTPILGTNRSQSQLLAGFSQIPDYPNEATSADVTFCGANPASCKYTPVAFNPKTVIVGSPSEWYNPNMFTLPAMVTAAGAVCTTATCGTGTTFGTIGNVPRGLLRGPGLDNVDFSLNKDTALPFLGEQRSLEFRAEIFNIANHPNFDMPNGTTFTGSLTDYGPYSEAPRTTTGPVITKTITKSRQIQLALKFVF